MSGTPPIHLIVWRDRGLAAGAKLVAARVEVHARGPLGWCTASVNTLASECGMNAQTVKVGLASLRSRGLLEIDARPGRTTRLRLRVPDGFAPTGPGRKTHPGGKPTQVEIPPTTQVENPPRTRTENPPTKSRELTELDPRAAHIEARKARIRRDGGMP